MPRPVRSRSAIDVADTQNTGQARVGAKTYGIADSSHPGRFLVNGKEWDFGRQIHDAALIGDTVVVTFIPDEGEPSIIALDLDRTVLWRDMDLAHFAHDDDHFVMYDIAGEDPLSFYLDAGSIARVDLKTGALLEMQFVK